jgi:hypothetical protein
MAVPVQERTACEEGEGRGNDGTSFAIVIGGGSNGSIQAAQGQWWLIAMQGRGVQRAGLIKHQQQVPPDGWGDNLDGAAIVKSNVHWQRWNWDGD